MKTSPRALTAKDASLLYGISIGTLANLRHQKRGPRYYKVGRKVLYFISDVERWITQSPMLTRDFSKYI